MAIEAPLSKYKKTNLKIAIVVCVVLGIWCAYDGYLNEKWIEDHTDSEGNPETYLVFNRKAPFYLAAVAVLAGAYLFAVRNKKIIADENELIISDKEKISYDSIQAIDKTHFGSKGFFTITYEKTTGGQVARKISDRKYDNLEAVLEHLVTKIS